MGCGVRVFQKELLAGALKQQPRFSPLCTGQQAPLRFKCRHWGKCRQLAAAGTFATCHTKGGLHSAYYILLYYTSTIQCIHMTINKIQPV